MAIAVPIGEGKARSHRAAGADHGMVAACGNRLKLLGTERGRVVPSSQSDCCWLCQAGWRLQQKSAGSYGVTLPAQR